MNTSKLRDLCASFICASLVAGLPGCVLGTKVGDLPGESTSTGESAGTTDTDGVSSGKDSATAEDATSQGATGAPETGGDTGTSGEPATTGAQPGMCEGLDEATCKATPACREVHASAFDFAGCSAEPQFIGCIPAEMACDLAITTVCREGTDEVYLNNDGCLPAGFSVCETDLALCGSCETLNEAECLAQMAECRGLFGAPHVEGGGKVCVDFAQQVFLACAAKEGACPPFVPTVCPNGDPDTKFDVPSGCIPFGFETCEGGTPACM